MIITLFSLRISSHLEDKSLSSFNYGCLGRKRKLKKISYLFNVFSYSLTIVSQFDSFDSSLFFKADKVSILHLLENFDSMRVSAINFFGKDRTIAIFNAAAQSNQHHGWLSSKENLKYVLFFLLHA